MIFLQVAAKDLRSELRTKESLNASLSFAVVILLLFSFAFDPSGEAVAEFSGGLLWLIASPVSGAQLFLGKSIASFVLLLGIELICLPIFGIFYNITWTPKFWPLLGVFLLGTWGMTILGTLFSALTVNLSLRELMLPMLLYPMMIPALMAAMRLTTILLSGNDIGGDDLVWLRLLIGFDVVFTTLALALVETILVR
jgi:heme exporter protein B